MRLLIRWKRAELDPGWISIGIEATAQSPATKDFNIGVLQV